MKYSCDKCNYSTNNKSNYNKHIKSLAHLQLYKEVNDEPIEQVKQYVCDNCNNEFSCRQSLSRHKLRRCNNNNINDNDDINEIKKELAKLKEVNRQLLLQNKNMSKLLVKYTTQNNDNNNDDSGNDDEIDNDNDIGFSEEHNNDIDDDNDNDIGETNNCIPNFIDDDIGSSE